MNESYFEIAFWLGRATRVPLLDFFLSMLVAIILFRLTIGVVSSALKVYHTSRREEHRYEYEPADSEVAPGIIEQIRARNRWRCSWFAWGCAWALAIGMGLMSLYGIFALAGCR